LRNCFPRKTRSDRRLGVLLVAFFLLTAVAFSLIPPAVAVNGPYPVATPFALGERLTYKIEWNPPWFLFFLPPMEAGEVTLNLVEETQYQSRKALKMTFTARSSGALAKMAGISVNDYFEFISDEETFCTYSVVRKEREGRRMRDIDYVYLSNLGKLHLREVDVSKTPPSVLRDRDYDGIPPCVMNIFSALYFLRKKELAPGVAIQAAVGEYEVIKDVLVKVEKKELVSTPAGNFNAWRLRTTAVIGGLFKGGGEFHIWLSADERKLPVKFEAKVDLGKATGSLKQVKN
jgi:hypothetical protein